MMIESPFVVLSEAQTTAVIRVEVPRAEIRKVMEPAIDEILRLLRAQDVQPIGPLFTYHHRLDSTVFDLEVGFPVGGQVRPSGRVVPSQLPTATVARAVYHGPYEGLGAGWHELMDWMKAEGHEGGPNLWERYLVGPETGPDASRWRTELNRPLVEGD